MYFDKYFTIKEGERCVREREREREREKRTCACLMDKTFPFGKGLDIGL